ncbi:hypothetical protein [Mesorhizobium sp. WSM1497]|uniref:PIN domain-containing protein n=1 Tax=Mesorhizobium sp. WSM1497 TaxID=278153 RepID=UPI0012F9FDBB|nr:hypothetical protein [Mesorhizobium sp. WSM1497]
MNDASLHRFGKNGQAQHGMDMFGYRNGDAGKVVGVQCKCKGLGEKATEKEFRGDFAKALKYEPELTEYFFTTTADDDAVLHTVAAALTEEQRVLGRSIIVRAWGWGTLEDEISAHPDVALVFDPNHSPTAEIQTKRHEELVGLQTSATQEILAEIRAMNATLLGQVGADATSGAADPAEAALDAEIDRYRDRANNGKPRSALDLLLDLIKTLTDKNSGHIWFRVKANIAHCYLQLGDESSSAEMLEEAVKHAPDDPKAAVNVILAMMLRGRYHEAMERGLAELSKSPDNEALAGYVVQAGGFAGATDIMDRIPEGLKFSEAVQKYQLLNLRNSNDRAWIDLARRGRENDENDEFYKRQAAEAEITEIVEGDHKTTWKLTKEARARLQQAGKDLTDLWEQAKQQEVTKRPETLALCINGSLALLAAGDDKSAKDLLLEGLAISEGKDPDLLVRVAAMALELGDRTLAEQTFPKLGEEGPALLMRTQIAARYGNWDYLEGLHGTEALNTVPETERDLIKALASSASVRKRAKDDPGSASSALDELVPKYASTGRASVLIAQLADELDLPEASSKAYANALVTVTDKSHIATRTMIAAYAARRHDHGAIIKLMDGFVDDTVDSEELFDLASAFAYEFPPRARAVEFFTGLQDVVRDLERYVMLEGIMHYHRGELGLAEDCFVKSRELAPNRVRPILMHIQTLFRLKRKSELSALVASLDVASLHGTAQDQVDFAQALAAGGRPDDALALGYKVLEANRNDPKVALKWLGLCLGQLRRLHELSDDVIGVEMWARLTSDDEQTNEFMVVDGPGDPAAKKYGSGHSIAKAAMGHRTGDSFEVEDRIGRTIRWTVQQVRHKYLHAYEDLTENFNIRFPAEDGFFVIKTIGDDIEPFLDLMKRQSERQQKVLGLYAEGPLPISVLVEFSGGASVVHFTDTLRMQGLSIETCEGNLPERVGATHTTRKHFGRGIVLDTLTFWAVVGIDGLDVLKQLFGTILLARSTADEINHLHDDDVIPETERAGTGYFYNGRYYFEEFTTERAKQIADAIEKREKAMQSDCELVPVHAPDGIDPKLLDHIRSGALDPMFVAQERAMLLVTDDKRYRNWAAGLKVPSVWLQAIFLAARDDGRIGAGEYARLVAQLALLRHTFITCNAGDIIEVVAQATPETMYTIDAIAEAIGVEKAEIASHFSVVKDAILALWETRPSVKADYAIGLLMRNLIRHRTVDRNQILGHMKRLLSNRTGGKRYFDRWEAEISLTGNDAVGANRVTAPTDRPEKSKSKRNAAVKAQAKKLHRRAFGKR